LAFFGAETQVEPAIPRPVRGPLAFDVESNDPLTAVKRYTIHHRHNWRNDLVAADPRQLLLYPFRITYALDPKMVVNAENDCAAGCVCQSNDRLGDPLGIGELYL